MPRRNQSLLQLVINLPWPAGLAIATLVYLLMRKVAPPLLTANSMTQSLGQVFAVLAPYVAGLFMLAALLSFITWIADWRLFNRQKDLHSIRQLNWLEFERFISESFRRKGYLTVDTRGADSDIDLILRRDNKTYYVQCKHWKAYWVGVEILRELYGMMCAEKADGGFVVCAGNFSEDAKSFAAATGIELIGGEELAAQVASAREIVDKELIHNSTVAGINTAIMDPECPKCGKPMVKRLAVRGHYAGEYFWGCSAFPSCRRTQSMR